MHVSHALLTSFVSLSDDYVACPAGLAYAKEGAACVNFRFAILTKEMSAEAATSYSEVMTDKIAAGDLHEIVSGAYPETFILGLGSPGEGMTVAEEPVTTTAAPPGVSPAEEPPVEETSPTEPEEIGLSAVAIVFIVLAVIIVPIVVVAGYAKYRKSQDEERINLVRVPQVESRQASMKRDEFYDPTEVERSTAGSSLAAMGAAGAVVYATVPSE